MTTQEILNNEANEAIEMLINEFGNDGDIGRIASEDIGEEGETVSKIYKLENGYCVATKNFDTGAAEIEITNELDEAQKVSTDKLLTVA